ncbi:MAG TPA: CopG family transcriptional regulator [Terracidiphilus sp.]|nr:CopG family transcriptional regulator [Terracidiphilus sp.]
MVQVRLDDEMQQELDRAARRRGVTRSDILREAIRLVIKSAPENAVPRLAGIGCVDFGPGDLATNKKHLRNLGVKSMGKGWRASKARAK